MSTTATLKPGNQLWGIYHTDREYARVMGDALRTVVEAPTKVAAEEAAARLGLSEPWAHPVKATELRRAQWLPKYQPGHQQELAQTIPLHPHLIMQTPSTAQIRTAIEVLKKFGELINHNAVNLVIQLPDTHFGDQCAARAEVVKIEQISRIQSVATQLEKWRDDLLQQERKCVSHHV
jgi:hypothetical protein